MADRLEELAQDGGDEFETLLVEFNARTASSCDRRTFQFLYQAQSVDEFVDGLLSSRDAEAYSPPEGIEELERLVARAHGQNAGAGDGEYAGRALAERSQLPQEWAHVLGSGDGRIRCAWPSAAEIVRFALEYKPATTREELFVFVRRWIEDEEAKRSSAYAAVGEALFCERQNALGLRDLDRQTARFKSGIDVQRAAALRYLKKLVDK